MAYNNTVTLTGDLGQEARILEQDGKPFAACSLATSDSYKDDKEQWVQKETIWHDVLVFAPPIVQQIKSLKQGTRVTVTGSLSYRPFITKLDDGRSVNKKEATIIAHKVELKPLVKKSN